MSFDHLSDDELIEQYVKVDARILDPVLTDLSSIQQLNELGAALDDREISDEALQEKYSEFEEKGLFDDPLPERGS